MSRRWSVRVRLTVTTALLVLAVGATLLGATYVLITRDPPRVEAVATSADGAPSTGSDGSAGGSGGTPHGGRVPKGGGIAVQIVPDGGTTSDLGGPQALVDGVVDAANDSFATQISRKVAWQSLGLLAALSLAAVGVGWVAARRALAPVHAMTATARGLGATSLSERLVLDGPDDELRELGETFNGMLDRVEDAVERERRLLAHISHELRTPLANQLIALEVGLEESDNASHAALVALAEGAMDQNRRAQRLVEGLLLLARIEQGPERRSEPIELADVVGELLAAPSWVRECRDLGLVVQVDLADGCRVAGDPVLVERLIGNLLENAVRHNVPDGSVDVSAGGGGSGAWVRIANTGPVVAAETVPSLLEPFRRSRAAGAADGAGLGLSIVSAIAAREGVSLEVTPRDGGGLIVDARWHQVSGNGSVR